MFVRDGAWCVLKPIVDGGEVGVLVWAAWSGRPDGMVKYTDFIKQRAREIDARWIRFHTVRAGFIRVAPRFGWRRMAGDSRGRMVFQMLMWGRYGRWRKWQGHRGDRREGGGRGR